MGGRHQRCLRRASLTHNFTSAEENWVHAKKKTYGYLERDESKRQTFIEQLAKWADETIVYVDEDKLVSKQTPLPSGGDRPDKGLINQAFYLVDLQQDASLLTSLLRISFRALVTLIQAAF